MTGSNIFRATSVAVDLKMGTVRKITVIVILVPVVLVTSIVALVVMVLLQIE